jgi:uncharacterized OB-fold protein
MILGMVGGGAGKCGTPQFPRMKICVNPECLAVDSQAPYEFSDRSAFIKSFTGDLLSVSVDPPAVYGMIQFDEGGVSWRISPIASWETCMSGSR